MGLQEAGCARSGARGPRVTLALMRPASALSRASVLARHILPPHRAARPAVRAMATAPGGAPLDKSTPDSVWKTLLSADEVGVGEGEGEGEGARERGRGRRGTARRGCRDRQTTASPPPPSLHQFYVLRQKGTEPPGSGKYNKADAGTFNCAGCGTALYTQGSRFDSGCGWPAFWDDLGTVERTPDADGSRVEITCATCGGHLGHVFTGEGFPNPKPDRHCVNAVSIKFVPAAGADT